jgi:hypothetical protein
MGQLAPHEEEPAEAQLEAEGQESAALVELERKPEAETCFSVSAAPHEGQGMAA